MNAHQPEVMIFNLKDEIAHDVMWDLYRDAKIDKTIPIDQRTHAVFANLPAYAFPVVKKHYRDFLGWSGWFYRGDDVPCLQIVCPDLGGKFPWESGFDTAFSTDRPDLTENGWLNQISD